MACGSVWVLLVLAAYDPFLGVSGLDSCLAVRSVYSRLGFGEDVPEVPIPGGHLKMCAVTSPTCCTERMESNLAVKSRQDFDTKITDLLNPLVNLLAKKNLKFDEFFRKLMNHSRSEFDSMFQKTYGILYKQNAYVFTDLYDNLELYYAHGTLNLTEVMSEFFKKLYQRMFTVFNSQYQFSNKYLKCVTQHMEELQPFGDVPDKLTSQIKRSFVALRTFVQGLAVGRDVVKNVLKVNPSLKCVHELMRMSHCSTCQGHQGVQPCLPYCLEVFSHCLNHHQQLITHWHEYVDAMSEVGERLKNPFSIENVVEPINFKVSDAIMNFQESGLEISKKVFQGCGQPHLGRQRRQARGGGELNLESLDFSTGGNVGRTDWRRGADPDDASIGRLVHDIKTKIVNSRDFWTELTTKMCTDARSGGTSKCWNGTHLGKYESKNTLNVSESQPNSLMDEQIWRLKLISQKLKEAFHGRDVSWIYDEPWVGSVPSNKRDERNELAADQEDDSGSGSGMPPVVNANYPPDDEDAYVGSGNGHYPVDGSSIHGIDSDDEDSEEGSGWESSNGNVYNNNKNTGNDIARVNHNPVNTRPQLPPRENTTPPRTPDQPPSASAKDSMTLSHALTVYFLPAIIMFLGALG